MTVVVKRETSPTISIITVCYKEPQDRIRETSESIVSQDFPGIEWIVVDGGSNEETLAAIRHYSADIDVLISEPDKGIYDAMNKGIDAARGEFVIFMNVGDSFVDSDVLTRMADFIQGNPGYDCYYGDAVFADKERGVTWPAPQEKHVGRFQMHYGMICHQATLFRRDLYDRMGRFDLSYRVIADRVWILTSITRGARWAHTGILVCNYEVGGYSSNDTKRLAEVSRMLRENYNPAERALYYLLKKLRGVGRRTRRLWDRP